MNEIVEITDGDGNYHRHNKSYDLPGENEEEPFDIFHNSMR
jgi:hypothetical protein